MPRGWNALTTKELEVFASLLLAEAAKDNGKGRIDMGRIKMELFMELAGIEVLEEATPEVPVEEQYFVVRRKGHDERFNLYLYQIEDWQRTCMAWMDKPSELTRFPYPEYRRYFRRFKGPSALMQNFSWRQFRFASDYMTYFLVEADQLAHMVLSKHFSSHDMKKQEHIVNNAKSLFLATIFNRRVKVVDSDTHRLYRTYAYVSNQSVDNVRSFTTFSEVKFQCVLLWWAGMMNYLQVQYPKVFKKTKLKGNNQRYNPLEFYTRTCSTLEKYLGLNEEEVNRESYNNALNHLNNLLAEEEELKRMRGK